MNQTQTVHCFSTKRDSHLPEKNLEDDDKGCESCTKLTKATRTHNENKSNILSGTKVPKTLDVPYHLLGSSPVGDDDLMNHHTGNFFHFVFYMPRGIPAGFPGGSETLSAGSEVRSAGSVALPAGSEDLLAGSEASWIF